MRIVGKRETDNCFFDDFRVARHLGTILQCVLHVPFWVPIVNGSENRCSFIFDEKYDELRWFRLTHVTAYGVNVFDI